MLQCALVVGFSIYLLVLAALVIRHHATREAFWNWEKLLWGVVPACLSLFLFLVAARGWGRSFVKRWHAWVVGCLMIPLVLIADASLYIWHRNRAENDLVRSWDEKSRVFSWVRGEVSLPSGFRYQKVQGIDTMMGEFTSADGMLVIEHDIGELAGDHVGYYGNFQQALIDGARVRVSLSSGLVSFPDTGCANFFVRSAGPNDAEVIQSIASSFRPKSHLLSRLRPLLPEILRSDCRH